MDLYICRHLPSAVPWISEDRLLSKVLKPVRWARRVLFPPVTLLRQVVCLLLRPVFMCSSQGRAYTVSRLVQIKVMLWQPLTCDSSFMLPTCFPHSPHRSLTIKRYNHARSLEFCGKHFRQILAVPKTGSEQLLHYTTRCSGVN